MAIAKASDKSKKHQVLFRLKYKSGTKDVRYIDPGEEEVTFAHLTDEGYLKLRKKNYVVPVDELPKKDGK